jgi:ATP-dependent exoDNAse (exonuclease V) beta subunit
MRLEMKLDDDFLLVGIADLVIKNGNHISIIDWKSND